MGLNYLLSRHQVALGNASAAVSAEAKSCHTRLAREYARRIDALVGQQRSASSPLVLMA